MLASGLDIELHDHLDGSRPLLDIMPQLYEMTYGKRRPYPFAQWQGDDAIHHQKVIEWFTDVHRNIVEKFSLTTGVMQSHDAIELASFAYVVERAGEGRKYCEPRMAPQYCTFGGLTEQQVMKAIVSGIKFGEAMCMGHGWLIEVNPILCIGREVSREEAVRLVKIIDKCDRDYVVGIDLVCDEAENPPEKHIKAFQLAKEMEIPRCCHAGEWIVNRHPDAKQSKVQIIQNFYNDLPMLANNIETAVDILDVNRIGHAITLSKDIDVIRKVRDRNITIEGCPMSEVVTRVITDPYMLGIDYLLDLDVSYTLNSDDDLFMPNLEETFMECDKIYEFTAEQKTKLRRNAWNSRFGRRRIKEMPPL